MIALGFLKEERLGLDRALTGQKEMAVVAQEKADAEMAVLAKKNADEARAETVLAQAQETAVVAKENADGARAETVLAQETAVVANEQAGADPEAAVPKARLSSSSSPPSARAESARVAAASVGGGVGTSKALKAPSITEEGEIAESDSRRSETSGQALEREWTVEAGATTVRQEGVVAPRIAGSNVDGDSISDSENGSKQLMLQQYDQVMSRVHFRCILIKVHNNSSVTKQGRGSSSARRKAP